MTFNKNNWIFFKQNGNLIAKKKGANEIVFSLRDANCTDEEKGKADINHTGSDGLRFGSSFQAEE